MRGHESPEQAIGVASKGEILGALCDTKPLITEVHWSDIACALCLGADHHLVVTVTRPEGQMLCGISTSSAFMADPDEVLSLRLTPDPCEEPLDIIWDRARLRRMLISRQLTAAFSNHPFLWLYVSGRQPLMFSVLRKVRLTEPLLYWRFSE